MNIREVSSQFSLLIFSKNINLGPSLKVTLGRGGYEVFFIENENNLVPHIKESHPHLVILDITDLTKPLSDLVEEINNLSAEIKIIFLSKDEHFQILREYDQYGLHDVINSAQNQIDSKVLWSVDKCCENLYLNYKNEQLFQELKSFQEKSSLMENEVVKLKKDQEASNQISVADFIVDLNEARNKDEIVNSLFSQIQEFSCLFFKYIPSMNSFILTSVAPISQLQNQGVGCALAPEETKDLVKQLELNFIPPSLGNLISKLFSYQNPIVSVIKENEELEGVFIYSSISDLNRLNYFKNLLSVTKLYYSYFSLAKKIDHLEVQDPMTEVYNRKFFDKKIVEEFERSRRLKQPLSLIKISIDDYDDIEKSLGIPSRDQLIKSIATTINRTGRTNDFTCRTNENEFSVILPHCDKKGATLRAERLRRLVETQTMAESGLNITASLGVSEFPSLAGSISHLVETAEKARNFILSKGGNRICLYKAPADFKPEFQPLDTNQLINVEAGRHSND